MISEFGGEKKMVPILDSRGLPLERVGSDLSKAERIKEIFPQGSLTSRDFVFRQIGRLMEEFDMNARSIVERGAFLGILQGLVPKGEKDEELKKAISEWQAQKHKSSER
jgi:hypothetical protein